MYNYYNANPLGIFEDDCVIRSISCATDRSWDAVYDELSDLAQERGTLLDKKEFVRWYLDANFTRISNPPYKVYQVAEMFKNHIVLCTMRSHIVCIKFGRILDTFDPSDKEVERVYLVR